MGSHAGMLPVIDIGPLLAAPATAGRDLDVRRIAADLDAACRQTGFFRLAGHGLASDRLIPLARRFFDLDDAEKARWAMTGGGRAWRGWFGVGDELTSGRPDRKEGIYFGAELGPDDPRVAAGVPLHGANLFPAAAWRDEVLAYIERGTNLAQALMAAFAVGLGLDPDWFRANLCRDPTVLLRVFHYPPAGNVAVDDGDEHWGVGEHTDYGLLTILAQDGVPGLQVHAAGGWVDVPPDPDLLVCNIGDMLERLTGGAYRSTPHRVRNHSDRGRISIPFFFDPSWDAVVPRLPIATAGSRARRRWDGGDPLAWEGTYGDYLTAKVAEVFPALFEGSIGATARAATPRWPAAGRGG